MSAFRSLLLFLVVIRSSLGEKQEDSSCNEIHRAIEKIDQLDTSFNELKQMIMDNNHYPASHDAAATVTRREKNDIAKSRTRREKEDVQLGNVFVTPFNTAIQTCSDVKAFLNDAIPAMMDDIRSIKEKQMFCERPKSCLEHLRIGHTVSGVYKIYTAQYVEGIKVFCDQETDDGGWVVFQRRQDGSVDFYRDWSEYETGFGDLEGEFWLGNYNLHRLTFGSWKELRIDLGDFDNKKAYAKYAKFMIGSKSTNYVLTAEGYSGNAGDSLTYHDGQQFSTYDRDNDKWPGSCAQAFKGAWWHKDCLLSNLNGLYDIANKRYNNAINLHWDPWKRRYPLKFSEMKFREHDRN